MKAKKTEAVKTVKSDPGKWIAVSRFRGIDEVEGVFIEAPMFSDSLVELQQNSKTKDIRVEIVGD